MDILIKKENIVENFRVKTAMKEIADRFNKAHNYNSPTIPLSEALKNPECVKFILKENASFFPHIPESYQNDKEFLLKVINKNSSVLEYVKEEFKIDKEFILNAVKENGFALKHANFDLQNDSEVVLEAVKNSGSSLGFASKNLRDSKEIVLAAVNQNSEAIKFASETLRNDNDVGISVGKNTYAIQYLSTDARKYAQKIRQEEYNHDREIQAFIIKNAVYKEPAKVESKEISSPRFPELAEKMKLSQLLKEFYSDSNTTPSFNEAVKDPNFILHVVKKDGNYLKYASEEIKNNQEIVLEATKNDVKSFKYASDTLKNDREVVYENVKKDGNILFYASDALKNDKKIVLEAVKNNGNSLKYASKELKNDKEIFHCALKNNSNAIRHVSKELQDYVLENGIDKLLSQDISSRITDVLGKFRTFLKPSENTNRNTLG